MNGLPPRPASLTERHKSLCFKCPLPDCSEYSAKCALRMLWREGRGEPEPEKGEA